MTLTYSHRKGQMPMYKGPRAREGNPFSLPFPSRIFLRPLPSYFSVELSTNLGICKNKCEAGDPKREGDGRDIQSHSRPSNALYIRG